MASIKSLRIASAVAQNPNISFHKSWFGLVTKAVYTPTGSPVDAFQLEYTKEDGAPLVRLLTARPSDLKAVVEATGTLRDTHVGNLQLDLCLSRDHRFAAMRLFRYADFKYKPETELRIFEGADAELVGKLF